MWGKDVRIRSSCLDCTNGRRGSRLRSRCAPLSAAPAGTPRRSKLLTLNAMKENTPVPNSSVKFSPPPNLRSLPRPATALRLFVSPCPANTYVISCSPTSRRGRQTVQTPEFPPQRRSAVHVALVLRIGMRVPPPKPPSTGLSRPFRPPTARKLPNRATIRMIFCTPHPAIQASGFPPPSRAVGDRSVASPTVSKPEHLSHLSAQWPVPRIRFHLRRQGGFWRGKNPKLTTHST